MLSGLKDRLLTPHSLDVYIAENKYSFNELAEQSGMDRQLAEQELANAERKIAGLMTSIEDGLHTPCMKGKLSDLERIREEQCGIRVALGVLPTPVLPNDLPAQFQQQIADLVSGLNQAEVLPAAMETLWCLITSAWMKPDLFPEAPSFTTRVCGSGFHSLRSRFGQARQARSRQIAQASGALLRVFGCRAMSAV